MPFLLPGPIFRQGWGKEAKLAPGLHLSLTVIILFGKNKPVRKPRNSNNNKKKVGSRLFYDDAHFVNTMHPLEKVKRFKLAYTHYMLSCNSVFLMKSSRKCVKWTRRGSPTYTTHFINMFQTKKEDIPPTTPQGHLGNAVTLSAAIPQPGRFRYTIMLQHQNNDCGIKSCTHKAGLHYAYKRK